MTDIARLGIQVDSTGAIKATKDLSALAAAADETTSAATDAGVAVVGVGGSAKEAGAAFVTLAAPLRDAATGISDVQARIAQVIPGLQGLGGSARDSARAFMEIDQARSAFERLRMSIDPVYAASMQYEQAVEAVSAAVDRGAVSHAQASRVLEIAEQKYLGAAAAADRLGDQATVTGRQVKQAATNTNRGFSSMAGGMRGVTQQLSQVAQQGQATGDYVQALAIQGADIGMAFGIWGTVIGVAAGALLPFAANLVGAADDGKEFEKVLESLDEAATNFTRSVKAARAPLSDLIGEYGTMAGRARELMEIQVQLDKATANMATAKATKSLSDAFSADQFSAIDPAAFALGAETLSTYTAALDDQLVRLMEINAASGTYSASVHERMAAVEAELSQLSNLGDNLAELGETLGVSAEKARGVAAAMGELARAEGAREQADAMIALGDEIERATDGFTKGDEAAYDLYQQLLQAASAALQVAANADDMAPAIGDSADEADRLKSNLAAAVALFNAVSLQQSKVYSGRGGDPRLYGEGGRESGDNYRADVDYVSIDEIIAKYNKKSGSGSGSKTSQTDRDAERLHNERLREAERITLSLEDATARYNRELADLNELYNMGYLSAGAFKEAQQLLQDEMNADKFAAITEGVAGFTDALFEGGDALKDWARTAVIELAKVATQMLILKALGLPTAGVMSGGGFLGSLFAGFFDGGGSIPSGQVGIAGENGPEIIKGPAHVTSTADTAKAMGGTQAVDVRVVMDDDGKLGAIVEKRARAAVSRAAPGIVRQSVSATYTAAREEPIG